MSYLGMLFMYKTNAHVLLFRVRERCVCVCLSLSLNMFACVCTCVVIIHAQVVLIHALRHNYVEYSL